MILHWDVLALHYGTEINPHRPRFEAAGQTTYALLCCRFAEEGDRLAASAGDHAEARLLQSTMWREQIPRALEHWGPLSSPIVVTLAVNRSPCQNCTRLLVEALNDLHRRFPVACDRNRFILAARGAYEDARMTNATRRSDLVRLREAGWELAVLQVGATLSDRGRILLQGVEELAGRGFVRLG